jgi:Cytochrome c
VRTISVLVFATLSVLIMAYSQGRAEESRGYEGGAAAKQGQKLDDATMAQWSRRGQEGDWMAEELAKHKVVTPADNSHLIGKGQGATYGMTTPQDVKVWEQETYKLAVEGSRIFHSADRLQSDIAVSCDMCHPDGSNNHPETYPKFQVQLGRVALLRDMINWCIENPVRGKKLEPDSPEMRALEAYLYAQRKGVPLEYGKR